MKKTILSRSRTARLGRMAIAAVALLAASCKGKSGNHGGDGQVDFAGFVYQQIDATSEETQAVQVDGVNFQNQDTVGEEAFEPLFNL